MHSLVNTTGEHENAHTCNALDRYIKIVGMLDNIIQICTNNVSK
jgi:hypothetical protein